MKHPYKNPRDLFVHRVAVLAVDEFSILYRIHLLKHQSFLHLSFSSLNNELESIELIQVYKVYKDYMRNKRNNTYYLKHNVIREFFNCLTHYTMVYNRVSVPVYLFLWRFQ